MLLTSGLKGYIDKPGYYFADITLRKLQELDVLLMVHGWRQYDLSQLISGKNEKLLQQSAEKELLLQRTDSFFSIKKRNERYGGKRHD